MNTGYKIILPLIGLGGFLLFYLSAASMIKILEGATIVAFVTSPVIAFLNLRAIQSDAIQESHRPRPALIMLAYVGLTAMSAFSLYYLWDLLI